MEKKDVIKFKIGDFVEFYGYQVSCESERKRYEKGLCPVQNDERHLKVGEVYKVVAINDASYGFFIDIQGIGVNGDQISVHGNSSSSFIKINNKNNNMNIIQTIKKITRKQPEKTFVNAGFIDENEEITEKGLEALHYLIWKKNKIELKKLADEIIKETEE